MKKIVFILSSLFCLNGFSQASFVVTNIANSATIAANGIVNAVTIANSTTANDFDITNTSSSTKSYNVKRYDIILHSTATATADAHFCYNQSCYPDFTMIAGPVTLNPGQSASQSTVPNTYLTTDLDEANTVGYSVVKYTFINASNPSDSIQFSMKYNSGPLGISEVSANQLSSLELFPNPATDVTTLKVISQKATDAKVIIFNALGAAVSEKEISLAEGKNKIELDVNELNSGIYFAQIKMANSSVTKKLVIK